MKKEQFAQEVANKLEESGFSLSKEWVETFTKKVFENTPEVELTEEFIENIVASYKKKCKEKQAQLR